MEYRVTWTIDLEAESIEDATRLAREIQQKPDSVATNFIVEDRHGNTSEVWAGPQYLNAFPGQGNGTEIYVCVTMKDGIVRDVRAFATASSAREMEAAWLATHELTGENLREDASDWGTGIAVWTCDLRP